MLTSLCYSEGVIVVTAGHHDNYLAAAHLLLALQRLYHSLQFSHYREILLSFAPSNVGQVSEDVGISKYKSEKPANLTWQPLRSL